MDFSAPERARRIRLVLFDVDGVLTDGKIWTLPAAIGNQGENTFEPKGFHAHDGIGISLARIGGIHTGVVTKRTSEPLPSVPAPCAWNTSTWGRTTRFVLSARSCSVRRSLSTRSPMWAMM